VIQGGIKHKKKIMHALTGTLTVIWNSPHCSDSLLLNTESRILLSGTPPEKWGGGTYTHLLLWRSFFILFIFKLHL